MRLFVFAVQQKSLAAECFFVIQYPGINHTEDEP